MRLNMRRKIVKQGAATLTISLPSKWVQRYALQNGDDLEVNEQNNSLVIKTDKNQGIQEKTIDISNLNPIINRAIVAAYQQGYDEIKLTGKLENNFDVRPILNQLMGLEIVEQINESIVLKDLTATNSTEFENIYRRMFLILKQIIEDGTNELASGNMENLTKLVERDIEINKLSHLSLRLLNKRGHEDHQKIPMLFLVISRVEEVADNYAKLFKNVIQNKLVLNKNAVDIYKEISNVYTLCYEFSFSHKQSIAKEIAHKYDSINEKIQNSISTSSENNQASNLLHMKSILEKMIYIQGVQLAYIN